MRTVGNRVLAQIALIAILSLCSLAQSQFVGSWQTKISPATGKHLFTFTISHSDGAITGTMILVDPVNGSETTSEISDAKSSAQTLTFTTKVRNDTFDWQLAVKKGSRGGLLHGSMREMVIDERVFKSKE